MPSPTGRTNQIAVVQSSARENKPQLLGTLNEFKNRFVNPIQVLASNFRS